MAESINDTVTKIMDKLVINKFVEKADFIKKCLVGIGIFSIVSSCFTIFNQYCITGQLYRLRKELERQRIIANCQMKNILEHNIKLSMLLEKNGLTKENSDTKLNKNTDIEFNIESTENPDKLEHEDNECYDDIPININTSTSMSGLKSLIWFVKNL